MIATKILEQSLDQLEKHSWGECKGEPSIIHECNRLRHIPLKEYKPADLCVMIEQFIGLEYLIPLALDVLQNDPLIKCTESEGDLLENVMAIDLNYWEENESQGQVIKNIVRSLDLESLSDMRLKRLIQEFC